MRAGQRQSGDAREWFCIRPARLHLTNGASQQILVFGIRWVGWGTPSAAGVGQSKVCQDGRCSQKNVRLVARGRLPSYCGGWYYSRLELTANAHQSTTRLGELYCGD